jgi:hypothetical protein
VADAELRLIACGGTFDGICPAERLMPESAGRKAR